MIRRPQWSPPGILSSPYIIHTALFSTCILVLAWCKIPFPEKKNKNKQSVSVDYILRARILSFAFLTLRSGFFHLMVSIDWMWNDKKVSSSCIWNTSISRVSMTDFLCKHKNIYMTKMFSNGKAILYCMLYIPFCKLEISSFVRWCFKTLELKRTEKTETEVFNTQISKDLHCTRTCRLRRGMKLPIKERKKKRDKSRVMGQWFQKCWQDE